MENSAPWESKDVAMVISILNCTVIAIQQYNLVKYEEEEDN